MTFRSPPSMLPVVARALSRQAVGLGFHALEWVHLYPSCRRLQPPQLACLHSCGRSPNVPCNSLRRFRIPVSAILHSSKLTPSACTRPTLRLNRRRRVAVQPPEIAFGLEPKAISGLPLDSFISYRTAVVILVAAVWSLNHRTSR
jgi:hypothetical protein